jgi:hypothetical protein
MKKLLNLALSCSFLMSLSVSTNAFAFDSLENEVTIDVLNAVYQCPAEFINFLSSNRDIVTVEVKNTNSYPGPAKVYLVTAKNQEETLTTFKIIKSYVSKQYPPYDEPGTWVTRCLLLNTGS